MQGAALGDAKFLKCGLAGAVMQDAAAVLVKFVECDLTAAVFTGANLRLAAE